MKTKFKVLIPVFAFVILATSLSGCSLFSRRYEKTYSKEASVNAAGKQKIIFENVTGDVRIHKSDDVNSIIVKAKTVVHLNKSELENDIEWVKLVLDTTGNDVVISVNIIKDGKRFFNFNFNEQHDRTSVDIYVPNNIPVDISLTNGDIIAKKISNDVKLDVTNGDVNLEDYYGKAEIDIVNGKLNAKLDSTKGLTTDIVNGSVNLSIGELFAAKFSLETVNGKIKIDKELPFKETADEKNFQTGTIGNSEYEVKIDITNGKINLKKK
jgi:hypothetical protein